jgi:murein DD-endopeptidase MepM/ murein hydrolase activator NlpD
MDLMRKGDKVGLFGKAVLFIFFVVILAGSVGYARGYIQNSTAGRNFKAQVLKPVPPGKVALQETPAKQAEPFRKIYTVENGDSFFEILKANGVSGQEALSIVKKTKPVFNTSKIKPGNDIQFVYSADGLNLKEIDYDISDLKRLVIRISDDRVTAKRVDMDEADRATPSADTAPAPKDRSLAQRRQAGLNDRTQGSEQPLKEKQINLLPGTRQIDLKVKKGQSLFDILSQIGVSRQEIGILIKTVRGVYNLAALKPGKSLSVWLAQDKPARIRKLTYEINDTKYLDVSSIHDTFIARTRTLAREVRYETAQGKIGSSLYESAVSAGVNPEIVIELTDIFAHDINFFSGVQQGDSYAVLYEKYYVKDQFKGYGKVMAARFINQGNEHVAIYYDNERKGIHGYFDEKGRPMKKMFLKAPLNYRRISSFFSFHRLHPIFGIVRPHLGVDYAAPTGTPVCSLGQGKVIYKGWVNGFGQTIRVKHPGGYVTYYGHLSRFAKGLKVGEGVDQGDTIGYVGSTGYATGPHLDFRVSCNSKFINPLSMKNVTGPPLRGSLLANFKRVSSLRLAMLENKSRNIALAAPPGRRDHEARFAPRG